MRLRFLLYCLLLLPGLVLATHNRAGEIIVEVQDCAAGSGQLTACATIITYTETAQTEVDRDSLLLNWGDLTSELIVRTRIVRISESIQRNEYRACHLYPGAGRYTLSFQDVNRVANVKNIDNSVNIPFSVSTSFFLLDPRRSGCNSSPVLTQEPIDNACIGSQWTHNPGAFDVDGDSLAFEFVVPERAPGVPVPGYEAPNEVSGSAGGTLSIDPRTGQITWDAPSQTGEYNLAFMVKSFRNGLPLDTLVRDMQIFVDDCGNDPPVIEIAREEICVVAGEVVAFDVVAAAPFTDTEQQVSLTATGRPFSLADNPATFLPGGAGFEDDPVRRTFRWQTSCNDISDQEYFVVLRAVDNGPPRPTGLAALRVVSIKVVGPPPEDLRTEVDEDLVTLTWQNPYDCEEGVNPELDGFLVYRREGSNNFVVDSCETGLDGRGYTLLTPDAIREVDGDGRYVFEDMDVIRGRTYCYRVVAALVRRNPATNLIFEDLESIPSQEICVQLERDIPLLTRVDVVSTSTTDGVIDVCWILPNAASVDTLNNTGPYRYVLSRAPGQTVDETAFTPIATFERNFFAEPVDTCYTDRNLNTEELAYSYRIELFVEDDTEPLGPAQPASSVRLAGAPTDQASALSWSELVPWSNTAYEVFRRDPGATEFVQVATVTESTYRDEGLTNGLEYCYYIRAIGTYNIDGIPDPLLNRSQELCLLIEDNVPPCAPVLTIESVCDREVDCEDPSTLFNILNWTPPVDVCGDTDVAGYRIYFTADSSSTPELIASIESANLLSFEHTPPNGIIGCYTVTAVDETGNESAFSNRECVANCPVYELPNVFTPNGDGRNDLLEPRVRCFVERVDLKIYNRWGQLVFETENPSIEWNGQNLTGEDLPAGTYYYVGQVFERRFAGVVASEAPISGYVELITNR